jgi:RNA polymerase sigma-32 factor
MADAPRQPEVLLPRPNVKLPVPRRADRAVGVVDALSAYMAELAKYPPISREEEHELAVRWVEQGDVEAARRLVLANLRLVVKIAMEYRRAWVNVLDLIQDGNVGLLEAVQRYDPYQGVKLSSYAVYWIRAYILKYILDNFRIVRLGTTRAQRKLFFRLNKEKLALERQGFEAAPQLLAERLDVTEADVEDMDMRLSRSDLSTNAPARRDQTDSAEFGDFLSSGGPSAESNVADAELRRVFMDRVQAFAETLEARDRKLLEERVLAEEPKTLAELGDELGVSRERVRQLEARIVRRLRDYMRETMVDFEYYAAPKDE